MAAAAVLFPAAAYAAVPMINSAKITSPTSITIIYSEPVRTSLADYGNLTGGIYGRTISSISGSGTATVVLDFAGSQAFAADAIGTMTVASSTVSVSDGQGFANGTVTVTDGQAPRINSFSIITTSNSSGATLARKDDAITLSFNATKSVNKPAVTIDNRAMTVSGTGTGPYSVTYNKLSGDSQDAVPFSIVLADVLGNQTALTGSLSFNGGTVITTTPTVTQTSSANSASAIPAITQVTPVPELNASATPGYTFNSVTAGTIQMTGDCSTGTSQAAAGNNTITFNTLSAGLHNNCTLRVADASGNNSNTIFIPAFTVGAAAPASEAAAPSASAAGNGYKFSSFLKKGMSGDEVMELQKRLAAEGYLSAAPNGYFGNATEASVKAYQKAHNLDQKGYVGPGTRAALNG